MWGMLVPRPRAARRLVTTSLLLTLAACATHHPDAPPPAAAARPATGERDATGAYRFNMTQNGRRMSADEFDAWMKARGIRVAKGAPAAAKPGNTAALAAHAKAKTKPALATTAKPKAAAVAQAKQQPKPKPKPAAQEVSVQQGKTPGKQGTSEG